MAADVGAEAVEAVEFELALDMRDLSSEGFEDCVRSAAEVVGGELLFDMPSDGSFEDASRIAAVRIAGGGRDRIIFAILNAEADAIRLADRSEVGDRFYGFARAFVGVLSRIRDDLPFGSMEPEGSA
ncbi:hypothetical protein [Aurantimonas sp. VKM B-3413]|uniref:hypothetical protein n=1 Tax=Aurantimonas sp. VKM B-3413 TaxID=2779401 RepID=UPI001E519446|nr:hypothetical protein [Aurantimonas sp. VKM B-3413]MCB8836206.1 hypothetical protein [Aurantimonas sp. VKM B-3413]